MESQCTASRHTSGQNHNDRGKSACEREQMSLCHCAADIDSPKNQSHCRHAKAPRHATPTTKPMPPSALHGPAPHPCRRTLQRLRAAPTLTRTPAGAGARACSGVRNAGVTTANFTPNALTRTGALPMPHAHTLHGIALLCLGRSERGGQRTWSYTPGCTIMHASTFFHAPRLIRSILPP